VSSLPRVDHLLGSVRSRVPAPLVPRVEALRSRRAKRDPATRAKSLQHMRFLLEKTRPDLDPEAFVDGYIEAIVHRSEQRWHPDLLARATVDGLEHLTGRAEGMVVNFMHHGQYDASFHVLDRLGAPVSVVLNTRHFDARESAALRQQVRLTLAIAAPPLDASLGARPIITALKAGGLVGLASDVAGTAEATFCGRRVRGSDGAARIAHKIGAPVAVMTAVRGDGPHQVIRIHEPLRPRDFATSEHLFHEMLRIHEEAVLAWPEMADQPAGRWTILDEADQFPPPIT
jgi:lauroyl/myristoyl acyltransferase